METERMIEQFIAVIPAELEENQGEPQPHDNESVA